MRAIFSRRQDARHLVARALMLLFLGGTALSAMAQKAAELDYLIRFAGPLSSVQEKYIHEVLQGHEPGLGIWVDVPNGQVKVRTHLALDRAALQNQWSAQGTVITELVRLNGGLQLERMELQERPNGFPQFIDTGDPAADNAAYGAAKEAWIAAHPKPAEIPNAPVQPE